MSESSSSKKTVKLTCPISYCQWHYDSAYDTDRSFDIINMHVEAEHSKQKSSPANIVKHPKLIPPSIDVGIGEEGWNFFVHCWKKFCEDTCSSSEMQSLQLIQCASTKIRNLLLKSNPKIMNCSPNIILQSLKRFALKNSVKPQSKSAKIPCPRCNRLFRKFSGRNTKAFAFCYKCFRDSRRKLKD